MVSKWFNSIQWDRSESEALAGMNKTTTSGPGTELLKYAVQLAAALREHARACEAINGLFRSDRYLAAQLVTVVDSDLWERVLEQHDCTRLRFVVSAERGLAKALDEWYGTRFHD